MNGAPPGMGQERLAGGRTLSGQSPFTLKEPRTAQDYVNRHKALVDEQRLGRYSLERQWFIDVAYFSGNHYFVWNDRERTLQSPPVPNYRVRLVANFLLATVETAVAKLLHNKPQLSVPPATDNDADVVAARLADHLLRYEWRKLDADRKMYELAKWFLTCGTAFLHVYWDGSAGQSWEEPRPDGAPQVYHLGDNALEVVSPFEIIADPAVSCKPDARWLIRQKIQSLTDLFGRWPEAEGRVTGDQSIYSSMLFGQKLMAMGALSGGRTFAGMNDAITLTDHVIVRELWELPSALTPAERRDFPRGRVSVTAGDELVTEPMQWPYDHGRIPYVQFNAIDVPGRFHGMGFIEVLAGLQRAYNRGRSQMQENIVMHNRPKYAMHSGDNVGLEGVDSEPGEILRFAEQPPRPLPPPSLMGAGFMETMNGHLSDMNEVSGLREVSRGGAPVGVTSGVAINLLQETDNTRFGNIIGNYERGIERMGSLLLQNVRQFVIEPRLLKIFGEDSHVDAVDFTGADLRDNVDVIVVAGSAMPQSKIGRQTMIFDAWDKGILDHGKPEKVYRALGLEGFETLFSQELVHVRVAQKENRRFKRGIVSLVRPWHDAQQHLAEHNMFRNSDEFERLDPFFQEQVNQHCAMHEQQLALAAAPGGPSMGPPQAPVPGPPQAIQPGAELPAGMGATPMMQPGPVGPLGPLPGAPFAGAAMAQPPQGGLGGMAGGQPAASMAGFPGG